MIQTTSTDSGTLVTVDTTARVPSVTIVHRGASVTIPATDLDAIHAIRSGLSRAVDAFKSRTPTTPTPKEG